MRRALLAAVLAATARPGALTAADGKLDAAREQVRAPRAPSPPADGGDRHHESSSSTPSSSAASSSDDDDFSMGLFFQALLSPFTLPNAMMGDQDFTFPPLAPRPYAAAPVADGWWRLRLGAEYAYEQDQLHRFSASAVAETRTRLGLSAGWDRYEQRGSARDHLDLGDAGVTLCFAQCAWGRMHLGLGARWLTDRVGTEAGFNATYGGEFQPAAPWTAAFQLELGRLSEATVFRARASVGVEVLGAQPYVGYGFLAIGRVDFHGPLAGVTISF